MKCFATRQRFYLLAAALTGLMLSGTSEAETVYTPYWFDGFDVTANTSDINAELGAPRQGGVLAPTMWQANASDYHLQMFGTGTRPLQLAGDANAPFPAATMASPDLDFTGLANGEVIGKRITLSMDAFTNNAGGSYFSQAAITIGADSTLTAFGTTGGGFSVVLTEDNFGAMPNGDFIQVFDGDNLIGNLIDNPVGTGNANLELLIDDPLDGNPWDGVGQTDIEVLINSTTIGSFAMVGGVGGLTSNVITLQGGAQLDGVQLGVHTFDNLTVFTGTVTAIPEPGGCTVLALGAIGLVVRRRKRCN